MAANSELRERFRTESLKRKIRLSLPTRELCTDNAAMVASAAYLKIKLMGMKAAAACGLRTDPSLDIQDWKAVRR